MRARILFLLLLIAVVASPSESRAEKVKSNQSTKLYNRAGERGKVIITVKEGQSMTVLAKEGRWLKVRVSGRTGFVARSTVDPAADEIARNTRRRSFVDGRGTKRGFNGEAGPEDRVGADALGDGPGSGGDDGEDDPKPKNGGKKPKGGDDGEDDPKPKNGGKKPPKGGDDEIVIEDDDPKPKGGGKKPPKGGDGEEEIVVDERATARAKAKTVAWQEADDEGEESFAVTPKTVLFPTGKTKGKFTEVENEEGDIGFVVTSKLDIEEPEGGGGGGGGGGRGMKGRSIDARARLGVSFLSQKLRTEGGPISVPDNYDISTSAATIALGGTLLYPYKKKFALGGELTYDYAKALPGIKVTGGTTSVSLHNIKVRALGGYDMKRKSGMMLFGRLGVHYQSYQVANVQNLMKNTATLPSEIITTPALGVGIAMPRLTNKIGLKFSLDAILVGASVKQTKNLEDGGSPSAKGAIIGAAFNYRWKKDMDIAATYDLSLMSMSYGTPLATSQRMHMGTGNVTRADQFHALTVGVARAF